MIAVQQNVPALRFKNEQGKDYLDWEEKDLSDVFEEIKETVGDRDIETFSITAGTGFVSQTTKFGKDISGNQNKNYTVIHNGEFAYNKGNSKSFNYGCIYPNNLGRDIAVPSVFIGFKLRNPEMSVGYFSKLFESHYLDRGLRRIISSSARMDGLLNINKKNFFSLKVVFPCNEEQQKIAAFLSSVDTKIEQLSKKKTLLEQYKKGMMQKLFSQEIRFKDEQGKDFPDWNETKAGHIFTSHTNKKHNSDLPILAATQDRGVIPRNETGLEIQSSARSIASYKVIEPGDFVISLRSFQGGVEYSKHLGIGSPAYTVLKPRVEIVNDFFRYYFKKEDFISRLRNTIIGIRDGKQIPYGDFAAMRLSVPSIKEQQKIANFLSAIDKKIELVAEQLKRAQTFKKGLLQQMFV